MTLRFGVFDHIEPVPGLRLDRIYRERLLQFGVSEKTINEIDAEVRKMVDDATEACKAAPPPPLDIIATDVYADGGWAWRN